MADQTNPWDTTPAADSAAQTADAWSTPSGAPTDGGTLSSIFLTGNTNDD